MIATKKNDDGLYACEYRLQTFELWHTPDPLGDPVLSDSEFDSLYAFGLARRLTDTRLLPYSQILAFLRDNADELLDNAGNVHPMPAPAMSGEEKHFFSLLERFDFREAVCDEVHDSLLNGVRLNPECVFNEQTVLTMQIMGMNQLCDQWEEHYRYEELAGLLEASCTYVGERLAGVLYALREENPDWHRLARILESL